MKNKSILLMAFMILSCAKKEFSEGNCVISPDGFTWKISKIQDDKYVAVKWHENSWKDEKILNFGDVSFSHGFGVIACPQQK
jgi:hypothetical protein